MDGGQGQAELGRPEIDEGDSGKLDQTLRRCADIGKDSSGDHWPALRSDLRETPLFYALKMSLEQPPETNRGECRKKFGTNHVPFLNGRSPSEQNWVCGRG